jgi:hypothetical protein
MPCPDRCRDRPSSCCKRSETAPPSYDIGGAEAELRGGGWPGVDDFLRNSFLDPADPLTVAELLERQAQER